MTIRVALEHRTSYAFARPVHVYPHTIRLRPAPHSRTPVPSYSLRVEPANHFINWQQDPFGNWLARVVFPDKVDRLEITVDLLADMTVINPFDFFVEDWAGTFPFAYPDQVRRDLAPYLQPVDDSGEGSGPAPEVVAWLEERLPSLLTAPHDAAPGEGTPIVDFIVGLNQAIRESVDYTVRLEAGVQTPQHTLERGIGSCRDSAWLLVSALRQLGLAARFVSGYLVQLTADLSAVGDDSLNGPAEDFTDLHAWAEVYLPGAGWVGLDATSGLLCGEGHIPLSCTPHPASAAPISGATDPVEVSFDFASSVTRFAEDPRVTRPVSEEDWARVDALGEAVDDLLAKGGLRLTTGGEPSLVAAGGTADPQWHTVVDVAPTTSWAELVAQTEGLYEHARQTGLTTERFHLDGSPAGTGGGHRLTVTGPTPADGTTHPRPDLLRSFVAYWEQHPALGCLFPGRLVEPNPQSPGGLLEVRGLELPPHPRMALLQALLVRALVARFSDESSSPLDQRQAQEPERPLLPAFVAADLRDVLADLDLYLEGAGAGRTDPAWFDAFLELRFPRLGRTTVDGVELELRSATEPGPGPDDEAIEEVQVRASGLVEGRHLLTCDGAPVPMATVPDPGRDAKGSAGAAVGGVRYRAWAPPSDLHPTEIHDPLTFDLVDRWTGRSLGGFRYHVTHPGGVAYDTFPVNAAAAESRRAARFVPGGHTPGPIDVASLPDPHSGPGPVTEHPVTLDLRRFPGTGRAPAT